MFSQRTQRARRKGLGFSATDFIASALSESYSSQNKQKAPGYYELLTRRKQNHRLAFPLRSPRSLRDPPCGRPTERRPTECRPTERRPFNTRVRLLSYKSRLYRVVVQVCFLLPYRALRHDVDDRVDRVLSASTVAYRQPVKSPCHCRAC